jgi:peptide/nickel transport system substrate-binding protein
MEIIEPLTTERVVWIQLQFAAGFYAKRAGYFAACLAAQRILPGDPTQAAVYAQAQSIFARDLPVVPLYWRVAIAAARPDLCNFLPDPTAASDLWNIEAVGIGTDCQP